MLLFRPHIYCVEMTKRGWRTLNMYDTVKIYLYLKICIILFLFLLHIHFTFTQHRTNHLMKWMNECNWMNVMNECDEWMMCSANWWNDVQHRLSKIVSVWMLYVCLCTTLFNWYIMYVWLSYFIFIFIICFLYSLSITLNNHLMLDMWDYYTLSKCLYSYFIYLYIWWSLAAGPKI